MFKKSSASTHPLAQNFLANGSGKNGKNFKRKRIVLLLAAIIGSFFLISVSKYYTGKDKKSGKNPVTKEAISSPVTNPIELPAKSVASYIHFEKMTEVSKKELMVPVSVEISTIQQVKNVLADTGKGSIRGYVKDANGNAISSADLLLFRDNHWVGATYSLLNGEFRFDYISPACYKIKVIRAEYNDKIDPEFEVTANNTIFLELRMEKNQDLTSSGYSPNYNQYTSTVTQKKTLVKTGQRDIGSLAIYSSGVTKSTNGTLSGRGSRSESTVYFMDGVRVTGYCSSKKLCKTSTSTHFSRKYLTRSIKHRFRRLFKRRRHKKPHVVQLAASPAPYYYNTESYAPLIENEYMNPFNDPLSTFSIDVDNASYANTRRMILASQLPPKDAVRIEEFINYFDYDYPQPKEEKPFSINLETASCPWNKNTRLVHIGLQGQIIEQKNLPPSNLVFLVDVSGSMQVENKLPLVKRSLKLLVDGMRSNDRIAIVAYAGAAGLVLGSTDCSEKNHIKNAIDNLNAGGSTAGGQGLMLAYQVAKENMLTDGNNRIILVTDGDFNVGVSSDGEMKDLIQDKRKDGIFLTVCGFGMGNYKDSKMETLADYGNGNYYYIDAFKEAQKVFSTGITGTLYTIAKDVKIQVEFNPKFVKAYRLIGYENRLMEAQDFANDAKDAGELGAGHTVTALYEIIPAGSTAEVPGFIELKYQTSKGNVNDFGNEMLTIKLRYKKPKEDVSNLLIETLTANTKLYSEASDNFRYACGVVVYGMLLRDSKFKTEANYDLAKSLLESAKLNEKNGYKAELLELIDKAKLLSVPK